jgi:cation transport ATPase
VTAAAAWAILPRLWSFPEDLPARLAFAAQAGVFVLVWVLVAVGIVSTLRRFSAQDIGGSAAGPPSPRLAIHLAFLQNTLEQAVLAVGMYFALASLLAGPWLSLIVAAVVLFALGRVLFFRGYARGVRGRALGMTLTLMPTLLGYVLVIGLVAWRLV